jgi:glycine/D-amino acid oxidase-like deaminating enzyme
MSSVTKNPNNPEEVANIVVIGGGLMGSATAWQLSKYGEKVLLIEQQDEVYTRGSSFGEARISRSLGSKGDIFSYLHQTGVAETEQLLDFLNSFNESGIHDMEDIYRTSPVTYIYYKHQLDEVELVLKDQDDSYEYAATAEEAEKMFQYKIPDSAMAIREYKRYSGTLNPKILISKLHLGIRYSGNTILYNEEVKELEKIDGLFRIQLEHKSNGISRTIICNKVVLAAGPYNGQIASSIAPYLKYLIRMKRLFLAFFRINRRAYQQLSANDRNRLEAFFPVLDFNPQFFYSMIETYDDSNTPILKVGAHLWRQEVDDLESVWQKELTTEEIEWSRTQLLNHLMALKLPIESVDLEYFKSYSCVYSVTGSEIPYVANLIHDGSRADPDTLLVGGMSGIGAKGSLAYGLIGANLLLGKKKASAMYLKTAEALGTKRLLKDIRPNL